MAMAERSRSEWDSYQNPNSNNCQDVGNSILILLGLIICINIGINLVTLVRDGRGGWGGWEAGPVTRTYSWSPCPPVPSSGADSASSYTEYSISFVRKVRTARRWGLGGAETRLLSHPTLSCSLMAGAAPLSEPHLTSVKKPASPSSTETTQLYPPGRQIQPLRKQTYPEVHLRCTMDPMKMTVTPPPTRRHRRRASQSRRAHRAHRPTAWAPDTDEERSLHQCQAICSRHWDGPKDWESFQPLQEIWEPWTQDGLEQPPQTIRFQPTVEGRPLKTEIRSEQGLEAYVYTVNPPPPNPEALSHKNNGVGPGAGAEGEQAPCQPASPTFLGPANIPEIPRRRSSGRIVYDARDVRRRLRELTREVEALSHCYPLVSGSSTVEGTSKDWVYRPLKGR